MRHGYKLALPLLAIGTVLSAATIAHAFNPPSGLDELVVHQFVEDETPLIRVEGGSAGTRAYLARRLQKRLRARAKALGLDPSRIYVDPSRLAPTNLSGRKLDVYLKEVYRPKRSQ